MNGIIPPGQAEEPNEEIILFVPATREKTAFHPITEIRRGKERNYPIGCKDQTSTRRV